MGLQNYILVAISFLLLCLLFVVSKIRPIKRVWLRRLINVSIMIIVIAIILTVILFPDLSSVKATGEYSYASCTLELEDESRVEMYKNDGSLRKLSVLVYYPEINDTENVNFPLIIFSHGGISYKTSNISLYSELASHGYVVVSIDHTYHALFTKIDGKIIYINSEYLKELNSENSHKDNKNSYMCFQKWMELRIGDINFVIDNLIGKAAKESNSFYSLIDAEHIGVVGHSLGGSAAIGAARQRDDIKAVIAMESPFLCDITEIDGDDFLWNTEPYSCAIMNIYSDSGYTLVDSDHKYVQNKNYLFNNENVEYYYIKGSNHYTLTDLVRKSPILCMLLGGGYKKSGYDTLEFINEKSVAFFDKHLFE